MPINFPAAPTTGDTHTVGDKTWTYDGTAWTLVTGATADHGNLDGLADDDHTQYLLSDGTRPASSLTVSGTLNVDTSTLHVDATNNRVGIGTASPSQTLQLGETSGGLEPAIDLVSDGGRIIRMKAADSGNYLTVGSATAHSFALQTDNVRRLTITSSGNVGINKVSPSYTLDVNGDINATGDVRVAGNPVGLVLVKSQAIGSGVASVTVTNAFSSSFDNYRLLILIDSCDAGARDLYIQLGSTTTGYVSAVNATTFDGSTANNGSIAPGTLLSTGFYLGAMRQTRQIHIDATIMRPYKLTRTSGTSSSTYNYPNQFGRVQNTGYMLENTTAYADFTLFPNGGTIGAGVIRVYGYNNG